MDLRPLSVYMYIYTERDRVSTIYGFVQSSPRYYTKYSHLYDYVFLYCNNALLPEIFISKQKLEGCQEKGKEISLSSSAINP
jgi:hypothetical protein